MPYDCVIYNGNLGTVGCAIWRSRSTKLASKGVGKTAKFTARIVAKSSGCSARITGSSVNLLTLLPCLFILR
jgi:hypothetical protein